MTAIPPRLAPTLVLTVAWLAVYLLYLAVRPDPPARATRPAGVVTATTSATTSTTEG